MSLRHPVLHVVCEMSTELDGENLQMDTHTHTHTHAHTHTHTYTHIHIHIFFHSQVILSIISHFIYYHMIIHMKHTYETYT